MMSQEYGEKRRRRDAGGKLQEEKVLAEVFTLQTGSQLHLTYTLPVYSGEYSGLQIPRGLRALL